MHPSTSFTKKVSKSLSVNCEFQQGFGNLDGEYWLGNEHLYWMTKQAQYKLRVSLEDWQGRLVFAEYDSFHLEPESDWYRLRLGQYSGTAGDSLSWHSNKAFTTLDRDKDGYNGLPLCAPPQSPKPPLSMTTEPFKSQSSALLCCQVTVLTTRREAGGTTCAPTPT